MSFVSYAQNFEDVMLWRALKHIPNGTYVDVGAQHPVVDSVSKAFYEHGWRGIHIEPVAEYASLLRADRPGETVLQVALAQTEGVLELNVFADTGLSTAVDRYSALHQQQHSAAHSTVTVPVLTLRSALRNLEGKDVHWLKIDVEGFEEQVLRGWDSQLLRPWIMVIEATVPASAETDFAGWDPILLTANYTFAWFDGLNRFYVANEHAELLAAFTSPPNVFDAVRLSGLASSELCRGVMIAHDLERDVMQRAAQAELAALHERAAAQRASDVAERETAVQERDLARDERNTAIAERDNARSELDSAWRDISSIGQDLVEAEGKQRESALEIELLRRNHDDAVHEEARLLAHITWMEGQLAACKAKTEELSQSPPHVRAKAPRKDSVLKASALKGFVRRVLRVAVRQPLVKSAGLAVLRLVPGLAPRARRLLGTPGGGAAGTQGGAPGSASAEHGPASLPQRRARELSPRAAAILADMQKVFDAKVP
ncbi:FkbM family methyltransferase [Massilia sp. S19_KUP03_FR1]|uniref:FkbM family methyltransferase n=1 Tax=Massilia sp. S19_KUP03_FR1 TaxID=3025503 RepID=UPI002FCDAF6A